MILSYKSQMQVNSAQDWLTRRKRQIVAATYHTTPPPQSRKYNYVFTSAEANSATQRERFIVPPNPGVSTVPSATYASFCCLSNGQTGAPFTFSTVTTQGSLPIRDLNLAMSYRATLKQ
jgi:hypothetical protein